MESKLKGALPILASAFGQQFGVRVCIGGDQAWTNGDTIMIPMIEDPELRDVVLGYLAHEAAHVRLTNFREFGATEGVLRHLVNILEDVRIERGLYEQDYPGTKRTLSAVWDFSSSKGTPEDRVVEGNLAALFCNYMLTRVRQAQFNSPIAQPTLALLQAAVERELPAGFFVRLDVLFDKYFDSMQSTHDAVVFAKAMIDALKQAEDEAQRANQKEAAQPSASDSNANDQGSSSDGSQSDSNGSGDGSGSDQTGSDGESGSETGQSNGSESNVDWDGENGDSSNASNNSSDSWQSSDTGDDEGGEQSSRSSQQPSDALSENNGEGAGWGYKSVVEQMLSATDLPDDMMRNVGKELSNQAAEEHRTGGNRYVELDSAVGTEITTDTLRRSVGEEAIRDGVLGSSRLRSQMVGLLQAQTRARTSHREYGSRFDSKRVARAMTGERRIWKHREQKSMVDTSVHVLLDTSGSMNEIQYIANSATVSLALAISAIPKADVAVSIFPGVGAGVSPLIKRKMPVRSNLARFTVGSGGGTPMAEAMFYAARELVNGSSRNRKVMIVITDGAPNHCESVEYINRLVEGEIDVYAIGINSQAVRHFFKNYQVISSVDQLQAALFGLAKQFFKVA